MQNETFKTKITNKSGETLREIAIEMPVPENGTQMDGVFGPHWVGYAARGGCRVALQAYVIKRLLAQGQAPDTVKRYGAEKGSKLADAKIVEMVTGPQGAFLPERKRGTGTGGYSGVAKAAKDAGLSAAELADLVKKAITAKGAAS